MTILMPTTDQLPYALYRAEQVRELDRLAIEEYGIPSLQLMERAGAESFKLLRELWPDARDITVVCGIGNNGGDGFILARLANEAGLSVRVLQLVDAGRLRGDALASAESFYSAGGETFPYQGLPKKTDVIVDGMFGTGLKREVTGVWKEAVDAVNHHPAPVLALDIPSGINSDTGQVLGVAIKAAATISFIGLKQGMFTGEGPEYCGKVSYHALEVPAAIFSSQIISARRADWRQQSTRLVPRSRTAHKGHFGHLLVIGGDHGYSGAVRMAGEAAARCGTGLVSIATRQAHAAIIAGNRPELMCHGVEGVGELAPLLARASVIAVGPGLGQSAWSMSMLARAMDSGLPMVVDADGLNLLAIEPAIRDNWVLTPHPGEAARLLDCSTREIQENRFHAVGELQKRYGGVILLKGAGTLISGPSSRPITLCSDGNPGMATGGMGDLLTGIVAGLLAQGMDPEEAAIVGASLHGAAADLAAVEGERGMLACDLMPCIRSLLNTGTAP